MHGSPSTLAQILSPSAVDFDTLHDRHDAFLQLGRRLLGVESNAYPLMEIWPVSLRSYNLLVPNFFNVPVPFLGLAPGVGLLGTAITMSSRAAQCMYCSAHGCTIALRGGADRRMLSSLTEPGEHHSPGERALARVAAGMSTVPPSLTPEDLAELDRHYRPAAVDWLTHIVAMMGFLNKMMDSLGVDLEQALAQEVDEVARASGWTPGRHAVVADERPVFPPARSPARTLLAMIPYMPAAIRQDGRWTKGVPSKGAEAAELLQALSGYDFHMVAGVRQGRVVRALTTMLRDNLRAEDSVLGLGAKHLAGIVFARGLGNEELERGSLAMATAAGMRPSAIDAAADAGLEVLDLDDPDAVREAVDGLGEPREAAAMLLARAMATSPATVTPAVVQQVAAVLEPAQIVEAMTWSSLLALLHRLDVVQAVRREGFAEA